MNFNNTEVKVLREEKVEEAGLINKTCYNCKHHSQYCVEPELGRCMRLNKNSVSVDHTCKLFKFTATKNRPR
jgi:hypothetical protein